MIRVVILDENDQEVQPSDLTKNGLSDAINKTDMLMEELRVTTPDEEPDEDEE